jgi:hypothetical protein
MVARTGILGAKREYGFQHVPSYRSNPAIPSVRRSLDVERTNGSQRLTVLCRIEALRKKCRSILTTFTPRFRAVQHHSCGKLVITFDVVSIALRLADPARRRLSLLEEIDLGDQVGLDVFGVSKHLRPGYAVSATVVVLAAAAMRTKNIRERGATPLRRARPVQAA